MKVLLDGQGRDVKLGWYSQDVYRSTYCSYHIRTGRFQKPCNAQVVWRPMTRDCLVGVLRPNTCQQPTIRYTPRGSDSMKGVVGSMNALAIGK